MFDQLRKAFSSATKSIGQKELSEKDLDNSLFDLQLGLLESDVAQEVIDDLSANLKKELLGIKLEKDQIKEELIRSKFKTVIGHSLRAHPVDCFRSYWQPPIPIAPELSNN